MEGGGGQALRHQLGPEVGRQRGTEVPVPRSLLLPLAGRSPRVTHTFETHLRPEGPSPPDGVMAALIRLLAGSLVRLVAFIADRTMQSGLGSGLVCVRGWDSFDKLTLED